MFWEGKGKVDDKGPGTDDVEGGREGRRGAQGKGKRKANLCEKDMKEKIRGEKCDQPIVV